MNVIVPITVDDNVLLSSSIPELDSSENEVEWQSAVHYVIGDIVALAAEHKVYQCIQDHTSSAANRPDINVAEGTGTVGDTWQYLYPTNRFAMFDNVNGTTSDDFGPISLDLRPGAVISSVSAFNIKATRINVKMIDPVEGEVYNENITMRDDTEVVDWWQYYYAPIENISEFVLADLPAYINADIEVTFSNDGNLPTLMGSTGTGTSVSLFYDRLLNNSSVPPVSAFSVTGSVTGSFTVSSVNVNGAKVTLGLGSTIDPAETLSVSYTKTTPSLQTTLGDEALDLVNQTSINITSDSIVPVANTVNVNGTALTLNYTEELDSGSVPSSGDFTITGSSTGAFTIASITLTHNRVRVNLTTSPIEGETVTLDYTAGANPIRDLASNNAANLSARPVQNINSSVSVGTLLLGREFSLGTTEYGSNIQLLDFSRKETDEFGNFIIVPRRSSKLVEFDGYVEFNRASYVFRKLDELRTTPCVWYATGTNPSEDPTIVYGYYRDSRINLSNPSTVDLSIQIEGLI